MHHSSVPIHEIQENVRTYITHNMGGRWELIKAPEVSYGGKRTACYIEDGCSLHLELFSSGHEFNPVHSSKSAVGIILGTGNIGTRLTENESQKSLYMSRDGGLNWNTLRIGSYLYEIGDHGSIIVIGDMNEPVDHVEFTWDEGKTWDTLHISEHPIYIDEIIIEPNSISQQFIVYGTYAENDDYYDDVEMENKSFIAYIDFSSMHEPQCKGADIAGKPGSDYELWTPNDGRHGGEGCLMGEHKTYVRRKQDA